MKTESQDKGTIRFWYGHNFYVYGYHKLKDNSEKTTRNVFYINKISVK